MADIWGNISDEELYKYKPRNYTPYGAYQTNPLMGKAEGVASQYMSGKLTPNQEALLNKRLEMGISRANEGSYGMPIGAAQSMKYGVAQDTALEGTRMAEENVSKALPFMNYSSGERQYQYGAGQSENRYGQDYNQRENQFGANIDYNNAATKAKSGFNLGNFIAPAVSAVTSYGLGKAFGSPYGNPLENKQNEMAGRFGIRPRFA